MVSLHYMVPCYSLVAKFFFLNHGTPKPSHTKHINAPSSVKNDNLAVGYRNSFWQIDAKYVSVKSILAMLWHNITYLSELLIHFWNHRLKLANII